MTLSRRSLLQTSAAAAASLQQRGPAQSLRQAIDELVIAYNVNLPSWDPTVGLSGGEPHDSGHLPIGV